MLYENLKKFVVKIKLSTMNQNKNFNHSAIEIIGTLDCVSG